MLGSTTTEHRAGQCLARPKDHSKPPRFRHSKSGGGGVGGGEFTSIKLFKTEGFFKSKQTNINVKHFSENTSFLFWAMLVEHKSGF